MDQFCRENGRSSARSSHQLIFEQTRLATVQLTNSLDEENNHHSPSELGSQVALKRATLRKKTSSHQLDSCGSSDSGQGTNSSGSLAASSLGSMLAGPVSGKSCESSSVHGMEPARREVSSISLSSSLGSSVSSSGLSCLSQSSPPVQSVSLSQCNSYSFSGRPTRVPLLSSEEAEEEGCRCRLAAGSDLGELLSGSSEAHRQRWLMNFGSLPVFSPFELAATAEVGVIGGDHSSRKDASVSHMRPEGSFERAQRSQRESKQSNHNGNDYRMGSSGMGSDTLREVPAGGAIKLAGSRLKPERAVGHERLVACEKENNKEKKKENNNSERPPKTVATTIATIATTRRRIIQSETKQIGTQDCRNSSSGAGASTKWRRKRSRRRRNGSRSPSSSSLLIGGKIKSLQYFPISQHKESPSPSSHNNRWERSKARLVVCLDLNEVEHRQLIESELLSSKYTDRIVVSNTSQSSSMGPTRETYRRLADTMSYQYQQFGSGHDCELLLRSSESPYSSSWCSSESDGSGSSEFELDNTSSSVDSSIERSLVARRQTSERSWRSLRQEHEEKVISDSANSNAACFWRLVASGTDISSGGGGGDGGAGSSSSSVTDSDDEGQPVENYTILDSSSAASGLARSAVPPSSEETRARSGCCSVARLIRTQDEDPNNRPQLLVFDGRSSGGSISRNSNDISHLQIESIDQMNHISRSSPSKWVSSATNSSANAIANCDGCSNGNSCSCSATNSTTNNNNSNSSSNNNNNNNNNLLRLNSIDEEEVCVSPVDSDELDCCSLSSCDLDAGHPTNQSNERLAVQDEQLAGDESPDSGARLSLSNNRKGETNASQRDHIQEEGSDLDNRQLQRDLDKQIRDRMDQTASSSAHSSSSSSSESNIDDDDDDDYFYDDELASIHSYRQPPILRPSPKKELAGEEVSAVLATLSDSMSSRPLLVWAPSIRRVSCPVGQFSSFASWRQLWSARPPFMAASGYPDTRTSGFICTNCQRTFRNQADLASVSNLSDSQTPSPNRKNGPSGSQRASISTVLNDERKQSQLSTCSDYYSSFDQPTDQAATCQNASLLSMASNDVWRDVSAFEAANKLTYLPRGSARAHGSRPASKQSSNCTSGSISGASELRRQSTITGFDHYKLTAPRSPSLCLTVPPLKHRNQSLFGPQVGLHPNNRLSPSHSTGGSSSPSPTNWPASQARPAIPRATHHHQNTYGSPGISGRTNLRGFARSRLESLESDRGSSPSWSASTSSLRSSIGGGSSIYSMNLANTIASTASNSNSNQPSSIGSSLVQIPAASQPIGRKWSNETSYPLPATSGFYQGQQHQQQLSTKNNLTSKLSARFGLLTNKPTQGVHAGHHSELDNQFTIPSGAQKLLGVPGEAVPVVEQQQQQQAVYFFLCCCQRQQRNSSELELERASSERELSRAQALAAHASRSNLHPPPQESEQLISTNTSQQQEPQAALNETPSVSARRLSGCVPSEAQFAESERGTGKQEANEMPQGNERIDNGTKAAALGHDDIKPEPKPTEDPVLNELSQLLERLGQLAATASQPRDPTAYSPLMAALKQRLADTERLILGQPQGGAPVGRASMMRYSTPNLLLSSNFEHIMRQRKWLAPDEQAKSPDEPPEATEAWFTAHSISAPRSAAAFDTRRTLASSSRESIIGGGCSSSVVARTIQDSNLPSTFNKVSTNDLAKCRRPSSASVSNSPSVAVSTHAHHHVLCSPSSANTSARQSGSEALQNPARPLQQPNEPPSGQSRCTSPTNPISEAHEHVRSQVNPHDKSLAQARYLYSTLTSNATAILAATPSAQQQSVSPTRVQGVQRKQAQFVDRQQRQSRLNALSGSPDRPPSHSSALTEGTTDEQEPLNSAPRTRPVDKLHRGRHSDSSDDDHGDDEFRSSSSPIEQPSSNELGKRHSERLDQEPKRQLTPSIIESQYENNNTSRSDSQETSDSLAPMNLQQQLMDPAMHALWAQGADLDTGNGNFIMASRRRRSMHAIHQVQLLQNQHYNQPNSLVKQFYASFGPEGASTSRLSAGAKRFSGSSDGTNSEGSGSSSGLVCSRSLKNKIRRLCATTSIDEAPQLVERCRFTSEPTQKGLEQHFVGSFRSADLKESLASPRAGSESEDPESEHSRSASGTEEQQRFFVSPNAHYDLEELESSEGLLANLFEWNYPIFELSNLYGDSILSKLSYRIFFESGFFDSFKIPKQVFFNFFHALEEGYHHKPYHNRLHAADVLHAVYYLTSQPIDNFCQVPLDLVEHYDNLYASTKCPDTNTIKLASSRVDSGGSLAAATFEEEQAEEERKSHQDFLPKLQNHIVAVVVAAAAAAADSELPFGIMGANLTALEVMALYTAAAMHDYQHPGRTNSFLVATNSPLALLYNDRSVLENHHSAAAWALFYSGPNFNWLCNLEKDEFKRFRFMIIELILATDLMRHYELVSAFNKKLNNVGRHNIDWFCESDRLLVMEIIIKLADVNGPMKGHQLHCRWTDRIAMEFYEQGDEERALNLPVSLYMDRSDPRLPELQKSFINHLVGPLSHSYAAAGFFPKSTDPALLEQENSSQQDIDQSDQTEQESVYCQSKYWLIDNSKNHSNLNEQFLKCTQTSNLRNNYLYWDAKSKEKQITSTTPSTTRESDTQNET